MYCVPSPFGFTNKEDSPVILCDVSNEGFPVTESRVFVA